MERMMSAVRTSPRMPKMTLSLMSEFRIRRMIALLRDRLSSARPTCQRNKPSAILPSSSEATTTSLLCMGACAYLVVVVVCVCGERRSRFVRRC